MMRYGTSTYKTLSDDGDLQYPNPAMLETADVRRAALRSGSRNAGWLLQLLKNSLPLVVRSLAGWALWGRSQGETPLWAVGSKKKRRLHPKSNFDNTRALLEQVPNCLSDCRN